MFGVGEEQEKESTIKQVNIIMNGNPDKTFNLPFKYGLSFGEVQKAVELKWNSKYKTIKLFNVEGVEYDEEDLKYLKNNEIVYVSKGQQFDANSSFGEYEILKSLGEGGFGKVTLGKHKSTSELVAIKVMKADKIDNAHQIDLVFREVQNLKALNHPNIVKIYNCYALKGMQVVVIMEYMQGGQLLGLLKTKQKFTQQQARQIFKQIVNAISYCHFKNIIHRDLKLQNILLKDKNSNQIKVADFGISGVASKFNPDVDCGTLKYMCPEVLNGKEKENSPLVDVWALGCILYYMVIGKLPFNGATTSQTIKLIIEGKLNPIKMVGLSEECVSLIKKMLDTNPKTRIKMEQVKDHSWLKSKRDFFDQAKELPQIKQPVQKLPNLDKKQSDKKKPKFTLSHNSHVPIPKRLEKERDLIQNQLREYQKNKQRYNKRGSIRVENNRNFIHKSQDIMLGKQKIMAESVKKEGSPKPRRFV